MGERFTRLYLHPGRPIRAADGLLTGFHDARSTHLALLADFLERGELRRTYGVAANAGYLWHEFGDSHLILPAAERPGHGRRDRLTCRR